MRAHASASLALLSQRVSTLTDAARGHADRVVANARLMESRFDAVRRLTTAGMRIRVHGDYHLGQVLRTEEDFVLIDFEGEPSRSIAERRAKQSPVKDVAGMVRSYSYAAYAALFSFTTHTPDSYPTLERWADLWQYWAADAFLDGYRSAIGGAPIVPHGEAWATLLCAFLLDKALYELEYELNHRPDWVLIPLMGIRKLVDRPD
jgi:maltose alpha-D-glucosyltransferase/alpha-amylase